MSTSQYVNYSLRPSKNIQRQLAFHGLRGLMSRLSLSEAVYLGFGSIWFTDFVMAHNVLNINHMISIEEDEIIFRRAQFNAPYASVRVRRGSSSEVLPTLYDDGSVNSLPWIMWLDYDGALDERSIDDTRDAIERAPENSILLITFNGGGRKYGRRRNERFERFRELFGDVVPDDLPREKCDVENVKEALADLSIDFLKATAASARRPGGFVPAFRMLYRDGADMVTVGGCLPSSNELARGAVQVVNAPEWKCIPDEPIVSPLLTMREVKTLQAQLPRQEALTKEKVRELGFDLEQGQIHAYERYYKEYPAFAQIVV